MAVWEQELGSRFGAGANGAEDRAADGARREAREAPRTYNDGGGSAPAGRRQRLEAGSSATVHRAAAIMGLGPLHTVTLAGGAREGA